MAQPQSRVLALPGEVRNRIYRAALITDTIVRVAATYHAEPALLKVSKEVRAEAGSIYYAERKFAVDCRDWDPTVVLLWDKKRRKVKKRFQVTIESRINACRTTTPVWPKLLRWWKLVHNKNTTFHHDTPAAQAPGPGTGATWLLEGHIVAHLFVLAMELRGKAWEKVEKMIESQHVALTALNQAWA